MTDDLFYRAANTRALGRERQADVWSVSQVNTLARKLLEGSIPQLWVAGELSSFKRYPAGHCFFTLKDRRSQLSCVMWREAARTLPTEPPEGMTVHAFGHPTVYERAGRLQFVVLELAERGEGLWRLAFERLRKKLEAEGLLDPARKRPLPSLPACVGIVTSLEGAALRDVVSTIRRRAPWTDVLIYPARVQGDGAPMTIVAGIRHACEAGRAQLLIVGRGGGAVEDLRAFNDERVARAIAASTVPVISAVGHETDITLADLVADHRAPTPSSAAELAVPDRTQLRSDLQNSERRMRITLESAVVLGRRRIERLEEQLVQTVGGALERRRHAVSGLAHRLKALGPMAVLQRGYALALDEDGTILRGVAGFRAGMPFMLRLQDGRVLARSERVDEERERES